MKRHPALVPLSHDHHDALVQARRLRRAADEADPGDAGEAFLRFFAAETVGHFREEEELLFPAVVDFDEARELVLQTLLEHQRLHALAARLRESVEDDGADTETMRELGELLDAHIRHEERVLFPLIERLLEDSSLAALDLGRAEGEAVDGRGGPLWGTESEDLNATLLAWPAGSGPPEHVNDELDVLVVVVDGSAVVALDGEERHLGRGETVIVARGAEPQDRGRPRRRPLPVGSSAPAAAPGPGASSGASRA